MTGRKLVQIIRGQRAVFDVDELHPVPETLQQCCRVLTADSGPIRVHLQYKLRVKQGCKVLQRRGAIDLGLQLPSMVVIADADAVVGAFLGGGVQLDGRLFDVSGVLPLRGRDERFDDGGDAQLPGGGEDLVLIGGQQRCMAGRCTDAVAGEGRS